MKLLSRSIMYIFTFTFLFYFILQVENLLKFYWADAGDVTSMAEEIYTLLLGQGQNLLFSFCLSLIYWKGCASKMIRRAVFFLMGVLFIYLLINDSFYSLFFDHIQFGFVQGEANSSLLWDSFISIVTPLFLIKILIAVIALIILGKQILSQQKSQFNEISFLSTFSKSKLWLAVVLLYMVCSFVFVHNNDNRNLSNYPVFSLVQSLWTNQNMDINELNINRKIDLYNLRFGQNAVDSLQEANIAEYYRNIPGSKPNVILVVLESVGAKNIFKGPAFTELDSALTPQLFKWSKNAIIFPRVYNAFPGTTRSHITIGTGGQAVSWGSPGELLDYQYSGPSIVKSFKEQGYRTSLYSSLILLNTAKFYDQLPIDYKFIPSNQDPEAINANLLNSWGLKEEYVLSQIKKDTSLQNTGTPFFLQILTSSTHHPYSTPDNYSLPFKGNADIIRYKNAIHYTDNIIGQLIDYLEEINQKENTIIAITGDHGQAFGDIHSTNRLHRSHLYEENIRNFLLLIDFNNESLKVSNKIASSGDIMPTIVSYSGVQVEVIGQNLLSPEYHPRIQYMHNFVNPYKWSLLDGNWKYITEIKDPFKTSLFNLDVDPNEQIDVSGQHKEKISLYRELASSWYLEAHKEFISKLEGYGQQEIAKQELQKPGPKFLKFGIKNNEEPFKEIKVIHPNESLVAYTSGIPFPENILTEYNWISPSEKKYIASMEYDSEWSYVWTTCPVPRPLEEGEWTVEIRASSSGELLVKNNFQIAQKAELYKPFIPHPFQSLSFGVNSSGNLMKLDIFHPDEKIVAILEGKPAPEDIPLYLEWASPSAQKENNVGIHYEIFNYKKGWTFGWFYSPPIQPMEEGRWRLSVYNNNSKDILMTKWFEVSNSAQLMQ